MHTALRITVHLVAAFASIAFASGCRTLSLQVEEPGDASSYRSWDFVHPLHDAIHAPSLAGIDLEPIVAKHVEAGLAERGFRRAPSNPDLLVYFQLVVREQLEEQSVTGAVQHLASLHYAPSYDVQTTRIELVRYEIAELLILMIDSRERELVWRGRLSERYLGEFAPHLGEAVSTLLARVPLPRPSTNGRTVIVEEGAPQDAPTTGAAGEPARAQEFDREREARLGFVRWED